MTAVSVDRESWTASDYARLVRTPGERDHKGTRGRVLIVGGAPGYTGAVCLAADAALRAGAGYVTVAVPAPSLPVVEVKLTSPLKIALPALADGALLPGAVDAVLDAARYADAVVLGPGLGRSDASAAVVRELVARVPLPLLLDADALHALGTDLTPLAARMAPTVLTPHAGEAARLLAIARDEVDADREGAAIALAVGRATVVLKGPGTLIAGGGRHRRQPDRGGRSSPPWARATSCRGSWGRCLRRARPRSRPRRWAPTCTVGPARPPPRTSRRFVVPPRMWLHIFPRPSARCSRSGPDPRWRDSR